MKRGIGYLTLAASSAGFPLTQLAIEHGGRCGAILTEAVCAGLALRDASMVASGAPARLRRGPAALLRMELAVAVLATAAGLPRVLGRKPPATSPLEIARRAAVGTMFGLHTARFAIYLRGDHGLKQIAA